jgi:hypothetical protein
MLPNRGRNLTNYLTRARDHLNREHNAAGHCSNCWRKHTASIRSTCRGPRDPQVEYLSQEVLQKVKSERLSHTLGREDTWWKLHSWVVQAGDSCRSRYNACKCSKILLFPACTNGTLCITVLLKEKSATWRDCAWCVV